MDEDRYIKISDFGLSENYYLDEQDYASTPRYRPPEILLHQRHDFKVNYFQLGCIAHLLATLTMPYG